MRLDYVRHTRRYNRKADVISVNLSVGKFQQLKLKMWRRLHTPFRFLMWHKLHIHYTYQWRISMVSNNAAAWVVTTFIFREAKN